MRWLFSQESVLIARMLICMLVAVNLILFALVELHDLLTMDAFSLQMLNGFNDQ